MQLFFEMQKISLIVAAFVSLALAAVKVTLRDDEIVPCTQPGKHKIYNVTIDSCHAMVDGVCHLATNSQAKLTTVFEKKKLTDDTIESLSVIPSVKIPYGDVVERKEPRSSYKINCDDEKVCTLAHDFLIEDVYPKIEVEIDYGLHFRMSPDKVICFKQPIKIVA